MKTKIISLMLLLLIAQLINCSNPTSPPPPQKEEQAVVLKLMDVSCSEAFIKVTAIDTVLPASITLNKDNNLLFDFTLTRTDTIIIDEGLKAGKIYTYQAITKLKTKEQTGDTIHVRTLDTTSHNFTWQTFTFGDADVGSSYINDVTIIDENNIWAVGEIYLKDSLGQPDQIPYNAAHWDGSKWELKTIMFPLCDGNGNQNGSGPFTATSIFAISSEDIWITCNVSLVHWDGKKFKPICMPLGYGERNLTKIWGINNQLYLIGTNGFIAHYQNGEWQKIESNTDLPIHDIWGINKNGETKVLAIASEIFEVKDKKVFSMTSAGVTELPNNGLSWSMATVWFSNLYKEYAGGAALYTRMYNENNWKELALPVNYIYSVRGNGSNDIMICGGLGYVSHYNGSTWKNYLGNGLEQIAGNYYSISMEGNTVYAGGETADGKAIVIIGTRSEIITN